MSTFQDIYLERRDGRRNMARFYALGLERDLFGEAIAVRRWGRIGTHGKALRIAYADEAMAAEALSEIARAKRRRGYAPRHG